MNDIRGCCERLSEKDCFASAAMREAIIEAAKATADEEYQIQLVPMLLASSLGALRREIAKIQASADGAITVIEAKK